MNLKRGSVLGALLLLSTVISVDTVEAQAQGVPARVAALEMQIEQALASIAQLQAALVREAGARQAADGALDTGIRASKSGGVSQAVLDAAIAAEAAARSSADAALVGPVANEAAARAAFDATLAPLVSLSPLAAHVTVQNGTVNDLVGPHVIFSGANVHIRSGHSSRDSLYGNGRGNLVVGYNEASGEAEPERGGSHNVVVGGFHRYNFGVGLVVGYASRLGGMGASVSGGMFNVAAGEFSSVSAGSRNQAIGMGASVSGGDSNVASGSNSAVSAGQFNQATGDSSAVSGGYTNTASGAFSAVGGASGVINSTGFTFVP